MSAMQNLHSASKHHIANDFGGAAERYDEAARLQKRVGQQLLERMRPQQGGHVVDLGCGTGYFMPALSQQLQPARLTGIDLSPGMIEFAQATRPVAADWFVADAESLPLDDASVDTLFSSLMIQWCADPAAVAREVRRVLRPGGQALFSTLVQGTLEELREAWAKADPGTEHVNRFLTPQTLEQAFGDSFAARHLEEAPLVLWYDDVMGLLRELKALGARYKAAGRRRAAMAPGRLKAMKRAYEVHRHSQWGVPATWQVAFIHVTRDGSD